MEPTTLLPVVLIFTGLTDLGLAFLFRRRGRETLAYAIGLAGAALVATGLVLLLR